MTYDYKVLYKEDNGKTRVEVIYANAKLETLEVIFTKTYRSLFIAHKVAFDQIMLHKKKVLEDEN